MSASHDDRGATAVEYGLLIAFIASMIFLSVALLGDELVEAFAETCNLIFGTC